MSSNAVDLGAHRLQFPVVHLKWCCCGLLNYDVGRCNVAGAGEEKGDFVLAFFRLLDDLITSQKNGMNNRKIGDLEMGYSRRILP